MQNCEVCEEEGLIINLDPNFLVPEELLHQDRVFPWMYEFRKIGILESERQKSRPFPHVNDIFIGLGGVRNLKEIMQDVTKAWRFYKNGREELLAATLEKIWNNYPDENQGDINDALLMLINLFIGVERCEELNGLINYLSGVKTNNPEEYYRFRSDLITNYANESMEKHIEHIREYIRGFDQLNQTLLYVIRRTPVDSDVQASSRDFRLIKMFYGNLFEDVTANYFIPACINNIDRGRPYDQFNSMNLSKYLTINKAKRHDPFSDNHNLTILFDVIESTLRNASHHNAIRSSSNGNNIEYRSGDSGQWRIIKYSDYLYKCNEIMIISMYLLAMQIVIIEDRC